MDGGLNVSATVCALAYMEVLRSEGGGLPFKGVVCAGTDLDVEQDVPPGFVCLLCPAGRC